MASAMARIVAILNLTIGLPLSTPVQSWLFIEWEVGKAETHLPKIFSAHMNPHVCIHLHTYTQFRVHTCKSMCVCVHTGDIFGIIFACVRMSVIISVYISGSSNLAFKPTNQVLKSVHFQKERITLVSLNVFFCKNTKARSKIICSLQIVTSIQILAAPETQQKTNKA